MKKRATRVITFFIIGILLLGCFPLQRVKAQEKQVIKIGYFGVSEYYKKDASGNITGYENDYLKEISRYTGYEFEYVDCGTWVNAVEMLDRHEIDLVGSSQKNDARAEQYEYCDTRYGVTIGEIVTLPDKNVAYEDYAAIGSLKIGCLGNYVHYDDMQQVFAGQNISPEIIRYNTQVQLEQALVSGEIDAIASTSHIVNQEWSVIEKFSYYPFYFISWKGNTELISQMDNALIQIAIDNPQLDDDLIAKYFPTINSNSLTKEEQKYIDSLDSITFCFCTNEGYLCRTEDGKYVGINPAIAQLVCEKLGVEYREVQFDFPELIKSLSGISSGSQSAEMLVNRVKSMGIDVWGDFYYDQTWADTLGVEITEPYMDASYYEIQRRGDTIDRNTCRVAAVQGLRYTTEIVNSYDASQIVWCDDFESAVKAVRDGNADMTVINTYASEYYLSMYQYNNLNATLIDLSNKSCMATVDDSTGLLASALNKTIQSITTEELNAAVRTETAKIPKQSVWTAFIYTEPVTVSIALAAIVAIILAFIVMIVMIRKSRRQNALLVKATNAKSEFLAKVSHDIRTPMNAIINLTRLVEQEIDDKDAALKDIQKMKNSNAFLLALINDVLDISKIERKETVLNQEIYSDEEFIDYIHSTFDDLCNQKNITFQITKDENNIAVVTDKVRFNQMCFNLISNAVKYTPDGGCVSLQLKYDSQQDGYVPMDIYVIDNGIGMSEEFVKNAFKAFEQENRKFMTVEGTGLGLSIVREIVSLMNGTIEIQSKINEGTTVHIHLNMEIATPEQIKQGRVEKNLQSQSEKGNNGDLSELKDKTILLVEDHPLNQQIAQRLLEMKGMKVILACDGAEAVETFAKEHGSIDAILMDIRMPVMNGLEAAQEIRKSGFEESEKVPILALTANAHAEDMKKSLDAGMNDHVAKPIEPEILYEALLRWIQGAGTVE